MDSLIPFPSELSELLNTMADAVLVYEFIDDAFPVRLIDANDTATTLLGYTRDELIRIAPAGIVDPVHLDKLWEISHILRINSVYMFPFVFVNKDKQRIPVEIHSKASSWNHKTIIISIIHDMRELETAKMALHQSEQRFRTLVQNSSDVFAIVDAHGTFQYVSDAVVNVFGYESQERINGNICDLVHPNEVYKMKNFHTELLTSKSKRSLRIRIKHGDGSWRNIIVVGQNLFHETSIQGIVLNYCDITEIIDVKEQLRHMAYHDSLTNLPNRRAFEEHLSVRVNSVQNSNRSMTLLYLDVDGFKSINDTFGHSMGDKLLCEVSTRLSECVRENTMLARIGGDEFVFVLDNVHDINDSTKFAKQILKFFKTPFIIDNYELHITSSIGICNCPEDGSDAESLLKNADIALYRAKELGKNQYQVFTATMDVETYKTFIMQNDLRKALEREQLSVVFQPRVDPYTGKILSAEALLRWEHHEWGIISPSDFIPLAEESGLIVPIGEWVLRTVCMKNKQWQQAGLPAIPISVNLSGKQCMQQNIAQTIIDILAECELEGRYLELEITESIILENEQFVCATISSLSELGIRISIDDFGTGYSSLARLKRLPVNALKIDKSFILDIEKDNVDDTIVKSIIQLAHGIGLTVVAEGVETEKQLKCLFEHQCDEIQGYLFSRPVDENKFKKLLRQRKIPIQTPEIDIPNRRKYFRLNLYYPLSADMTIATIKGKDINIGAIRVLIQDIGPGGLRFFSQIRLPVNQNIILRFTTTIFSEISLHGQIVWDNDSDGKTFEYGVQFSLTESEMSTLTHLLNQLAIQLRKQTLVPNCRFTTDSKWSLLKSENDE